MFPEPTELRLIGCLIELIWIPKSKSNTSTPKPIRWPSNRRKFHTWGVESFVVLVNISHFSPTVCSAAMTKRSQQDSGEERVTAKSRPKMNLVARTPSLVSSSTSVSPVKEILLESRSMELNCSRGQIGATWYRHRFFLKPPIITTMSNSWKASLQQVIQNWMTTVLGLLKSGKLRPRRTIDQGDLIKLLAEWYDKFDLITDKILLDGTAQSVRYGEVLRHRSGRPDDINSQEGARAQSFVIGNDETELELSVESRSFVNRVNDQLRKRQKIISNVQGNGEEHSMIWWMFTAVTMEWAIFMGKNFQGNQNSIANTTDLALKKMFDISAKLVTEQDDISGLETIGWEKIHGHICH